MDLRWGHADRPVLRMAQVVLDLHRAGTAVLDTVTRGVARDILRDACCGASTTNGRSDGQSSFPMSWGMPVASRISNSLAEPSPLSPIAVKKHQQRA